MKRLALALAMLAVVGCCDDREYRIRLFCGDGHVEQWHASTYYSTYGLIVFTDLNTNQRIAVGGNVVIDRCDRAITPEKP